MRAWQIAIFAACVWSGCSKRKLHWSGARAPQIKSGGFVVPVPTGWRDGAEADDEDIKKIMAGVPGAHALVKEDFDGATIIVKTGPTGRGETPPCDVLAQTVAKSEGATAEQIEKGTVEGDGICKWLYKKDKLVAHYWMRFHGEEVLAIMCFPQDDPGNLGVCTQTIAAAKLAP